MVEEILTLSTTHISPETGSLIDANARLDIDGLLPLDVFPLQLTIIPLSSGAGYIIPVPKKVKSDLPVDLNEIFSYCNEREIAWILLDRDAEKIPGLSVYEWE